MKCEKFGCHFFSCQSLLLGTNVPNDIVLHTTEQQHITIFVFLIGSYGASNGTERCSMAQCYDKLGSHWHKQNRLILLIATNSNGNWLLQSILMLWLIIITYYTYVRS